MSAEKLEIGTKVKRKTDGKLGVVVPGLMDACKPGFVMLDIDGQDGVFSHSVLELEQLGEVNASLNSQKCAGCIFANNSECHRYSPDRFGWMFSIKGKRKFPKRIYPHCQEEICQNC
jgi:hypothetical protein